MMRRIEHIEQLAALLVVLVGTALLAFGATGLAAGAVAGGALSIANFYLLRKLSRGLLRTTHPHAAVHGGLSQTPAPEEASASGAPPPMSAHFRAPRGRLVAPAAKEISASSTHSAHEPPEQENQTRQLLLGLLMATKFLVMGAALFVMIRYAHLDAIGMLVGVSLVVLSILIGGFKLATTPSDPVRSEHE